MPNEVLQRVGCVVEPVILVVLLLFIEDYWPL